MSKHSAHRNKCRDCSCPVDEHLYQSSGDICGCCCHWMACDCEKCLPIPKPDHVVEVPPEDGAAYGDVCNTKQFNVKGAMTGRFPEDPEICHACDCIHGIHATGCGCSCHGHCQCFNCIMEAAGQAMWENL